mmetsp:Transcript_33140/g.93819  ORF Transcript_33140/g.93819 Transcript_33140/m.93819 type:complete len:857 (+) Transcript_33140:229-2799(+)
MDDDEHREKLSMDNDYEGGEWIGGEFFFKNKKQKRQQTAEEALYGVFAGDSDEEVGERRRQRGGRGGGGSKMDLTRPVAFVSTGEVVQPKKADSPPKGRQEELPAHAGLGLGAAPGGGLGFAGAAGGGGLGFVSQGAAGINKDEDDMQAEVEEEENVLLPTAFGQRVKRAAEERRKQAKAESVAKLRQSEAVSGKASGGIGTFEKHTKGIGAKLLAKMGYVPGQGLGKNKQGIAKPIEAQLRPKGMGMGFGDYNESKGAPKLLGKKDDAEAEAAPKDAKAQKQEVGLWKKRNAAARVKREYRTADEVLESAVEGNRDLSQQPILDMRGPRARLVTNLESLDMKEHHEDGDPVPMPELQHNLRLIVDLAESEITQIDAKLRQEKDTAVILGRQQTRQELELKEVEDELACISEITQQMEKAANASELGGLFLLYSGIQKKYPEQFVMYNIPAAVLGQVLPLMKVKLGGLKPLADPDLGAADMRKWRRVLESDRVKDAVFADAAAEDDPYCCLLAETVLPHLRSSITNIWQPRDPEPLLRWLEAWEPALPAPTREYILAHLVMPALQRAVDSWEPRQETVPIHSWLHPWLPWLGTQLKPLYQPLRFKLGRALEEWHPSDGSALALLGPWQRVFDDADWEAMLVRSIVPKLAFALDSLVINPAAQDMAPFNWFSSWANAMPTKLSAQLLERHFFPQFLQVLDHWLNTSHNYDEITRWYLGWKGGIPADIADQERVRKGLNAALDLMNRRMAGDTTPFVYMPAAMEAPTGAQPAPAPFVPTSGTPLGLRELVQTYAEENGVTFMPKPGRFSMGHQVYSFGGVSVIVETAAGVLRAQVGDRWAPVSMQGLLQEVAQRGGVQ